MSFSTSTPTLSVVMSVYNDREYLREALDSVLEQTGVDFEFLIVNDGSKDGSREILAEYAAKDSRIRIIDQENAGLTMALIRGCSEARGEFIARQDADDLSLPGRFEKQVALLREDPRIAFVSCACQSIGPRSEPMEFYEGPSDSDLATNRILHEKQGPPAHGSVMMRRTAYLQAGGYRPEFYFAQDSDLWVRLARGGQVCYSSELLYQFRISPTGISTAKHELQWKFGDLGLAAHQAAMRGESEEPFLLQARQLSESIRSQRHSSGSPSQQAWGHYRIGVSLLRNGDPRAKDYFWKTIQTNPGHWKAWLRLTSCALGIVPASSAGSSPNRSMVLDVLRGIAVLMVIVLHDFDFGRDRNDSYIHATLLPVVRHGYLGVQLFFVISGYCIQAAVLSAQRSQNPLWGFLQRRARRIYPPFWASLVMAVGMGFVTVLLMKKTWFSVFPLYTTDWLLNILLLQGPFHAEDAVMVYWSLSIEIQFYIVMAIGLLLRRQAAYWHVLLSAGYLMWVLNPVLPIGGTVLAYWPEFACGIAAHGLVNRETQPRFIPGILIAATFLGAVLKLTSVEDTFMETDGEFITPIKQFFCILCGCVLWQGLVHESRFSRGRLWTLLAGVGTISYSLYLTHVPIGSRVINLAGRVLDCSGPRWLIPAAFALGLQFLIGWWFFRWCERPWLNPPKSS